MTGIGIEVLIIHGISDLKQKKYVRIHYYTGYQSKLDYQISLLLLT